MVNRSLRLAAALGVVALGAASQAQVVIYNSLDSSTTVTSSTSSSSVPNTSFADDINIVSPWGNSPIRLSSVQFAFRRPLANGPAFDALIRFYDGINLSATGTTPVFTSSVPAVRVGFGSATNAANAVFRTSVINLLPLNLTLNQFVGFGLQFVQTGTSTPLADNTVTGSFQADGGLPLVGSTTNFWWREGRGGAPVDGVITAGEQTNFSFNTALRARFEAVPEPGTMIALGAGLAALAARRRRK